MNNLKKSDNLNVSWPIQESYSNISATKGVFSIRCPTHPRYELTNICMSQGCVEPLCPECFKHHLKIHNEIQTHCAAETLISMKENCQQNVQNLLDEFIKEKQRLHGWLEKKVLPHEEIHLKIKAAKENLLNMIYKFFEFIEKNVNSYVMSYKANHQEEFDSLSNKINSLIEELQSMQIDLNSSEYIKCMLKMFMQGFSSDLEVLKKEISTAFESWETNSHNYMIDETKLYSINLELMKYIKIKDNNKNKSPQKNNNDVKKYSLNIDFNKENNQALDKYKDFHNYLEFSLQSASKQHKLQKDTLLEKNLNQKGIIDQPYRAPAGSIFLEQSNENRVKFDCNNYFQEQTPNKFLCFFQDNSKKFHYIDLASLEKHENKYKFQEKDLLIDFKIPLYHRSIITPQGEIFLMGGIDPNNKTQAINKVYSLDLKIPALVHKMPMLQARYSHSVCFANKYIFVIGGVCDINEGYMNNFEKYDIDFGEWISLTSSPNKTIGSSICNFKDRYIYKFGGKMDNEGFSNYIEKYDIYKNNWNSLLIDSNNKNEKLPSFNNAYQINNDEIMVFGGSINGNQYRTCFLLNIKEFKKNEEVLHEERLREIKMEINSPGSFWIPPLMHENVLLNLQNVIIEKGRELCHFGKKRVIICNSEIWKDL